MEGCMDGDGCLEQGILSFGSLRGHRHIQLYLDPDNCKKVQKQIMGANTCGSRCRIEWMNPEGGSRVRRSQRVIDRVRAKAEWIVWLLSLSLPPLLSLSFESCKTGLIQCEFMPGWPCTSATYRSKFDSIYSWSISVVYDLCCCCGWCLYCFQVGIWFPLPQEILLHE